MKLKLEIGGKSYAVQLPALNLAIPLAFGGDQPSVYGIGPATSEAYEGGGFVGDVRRGGSCNFETLRLMPHCNGTHTECVGHLTAERLSVHRLLSDTLAPATLISLRPRPAEACADHYDPPFQPGDRILDRESLEILLEAVESSWLEALVVRTLPNEPEKMRRDYMAEAPPFFSCDAMRYLRARGVKHLLVDFPSVDRLLDEGKLSAHHIFFGLPAGSHEAPAPGGHSITELIYAPAEIPDGPYLLNLQIAAFEADAAPSRPQLFRLAEPD